MFSKPHDVNVRSRSLLKNKDIRQLRQNVSLQLPGIRSDGQRKTGAAEEEEGEGAAAAASGTGSSESEVVSSVSQLLAGKVCTVLSRVV